MTLVAKGLKVAIISKGLSLLFRVSFQQCIEVPVLQRTADGHFFHPWTEILHFRPYRLLTKLAAERRHT